MLIIIIIIITPILRSRLWSCACLQMKVCGFGSAAPNKQSLCTADLS